MVTGSIRRWLQCEGAFALAVCAVLYGRAGGKWWAFAVFFFAPDIAMAGYLAGSRFGAYAYNSVHSYVGPALLGLISLGRFRFGVCAALLWAAHIGFDRMLGYGLKYPTGFGDTHLGKIGKQAAVTGV